MFAFFRVNTDRTIWLAAVVLLFILSGCSSGPLNRAPVEDRKMGSGGRSATLSKQSYGLENAGKPGYYVVKPQDTLMRIAQETGQSHKDIARWNDLEDSNKIEIGQVLRVAPPLSSEPVAVVKPVVSGTLNSAPLASVTATDASRSAAGTLSQSPAVTDTRSADTAPIVATNISGDDNLGWIWPSSGPVIAGFDDVKNKGVDIAGNPGDSVVAAADGKVVYADSGLRGYGKLVILKHNNVFLTAYAHNRNLLVKEDQLVKKGQKIAEMGSTDADRVKLHFEVRKQGKPVDPSKYLPPR